MPYYDTAASSLNHHGEELCGDQVKILRTPEKLLIVLSDGLGSGVKANILARLTSEILVTMVRAGAPLADVLETVIGTLPTCKVREIAYAAFVVLEVDLANGRFQVINFDCPAPFLIRDGELVELPMRTESICGRTLHFSAGTLQLGDFFGVISDGVMYAGLGTLMNFGWGRVQIADFLVRSLRERPAAATTVVREVIEKTGELYGGEPGDDASLVGLLVREPSRLMVFTGPPTDPASDAPAVDRLIAFNGRKAVCGGTTGNIVGQHLGHLVRIDTTTLREDVPPIGILPEIDLVTEGVLTLAKTLRLLKSSGGDRHQLPPDRHGATLLAQELLAADEIHILAGEQVNPYYQNPLLPRNISIRHNLVEQIVETLTACHKHVTIEWL
ncbi:MAG: SpoIIE family protein phosphatase [Opitutae bacterium]|nr:SpoIIE family protein phosphatase [Opitutae bacterium]